MRPAEPPGVGLHLLQDGRLLQEPRELVGQRGQVVDFHAGPVFQDEIAVARLLAGHRIGNQQGRAAGQDFGRGQPARLGKHDVGRRHQFVDLAGEAQHRRPMARRDFDLLQPRLEQFVAAGDDDDLQRPLDREHAGENLLDRAHAEAARHLHDQRAVAAQAQAPAAARGVLLLAEDGMDGNAGDRDVFGRHAPIGQVGRPFVSRREVVVAGLIDPQAVRLEVGRGRQMRRVDLAFAAERGDDLRGQEVRVDDHVPGVVAEEAQQPPQVQAFDQQPQAVGLAWADGGRSSMS